jgi:hypothetical protein
MQMPRDCCRKIIVDIISACIGYLSFYRGRNHGREGDEKLRPAGREKIGVFTGRSPHQAALKAANRGHTDIKLRERDTKKLHIFTGERVQVDKPEGAQAWMTSRRRA